MISGIQTSAGGEFSQALSGNDPNNELGKDAFLRLLVAQLAHQDPLDPAKDTEFVAQLAQYSSLEQLMLIGDGIGTLYAANMSANSANMVNFIGKDIIVPGNKLEISANEVGEIWYANPHTVETVVVEIKNADGQVVRTVTETASKGPGSHQIQWDGCNDAGIPLGDGTYTMSITAKDESGFQVSVEPQRRGTVTGVTFENGFPELLLGTDRVLLGDIRKVLSGDDHAGLVG